MASNDTGGLGAAIGSTDAGGLGALVASSAAGVAAFCILRSSRWAANFAFAALTAGLFDAGRDGGTARAATEHVHQTFLRRAVERLTAIFVCGFLTKICGFLTTPL